MAAIRNLPDTTVTELRQQIQNGARFVQYEWAFSFIIITMLNRSAVYYIPPGGGRVVHGLGHSMVSLLFGWWGFPWGPIRVIQSLINNFSGGHDVTQEMLAQNPTWDPSYSRPISAASSRFAMPEDPDDAPPSYAESGAAAGYQGPETPAAPPKPVTAMGIISLVLGIFSLVPCYCLGLPLGGIGLLLGGFGLYQTMGVQPSHRGRNIAIGGIVCSLIGLGISALLLAGMALKSRQDVSEAYDGPMTPERIAYEQADETIRQDDGSAASGNCTEAVALAQLYAAGLATTARDSFSGYADSELSDSETPFRVYCHLTDAQVVFLVHTPELLDYEDPLKDELRTIAWKAAQAATAGEDMKLVIALRGDRRYDCIIYGQIADEKPYVNTRFYQEKVASYIDSSIPTRRFSFDQVEDTTAPTAAEPE